MAESPSHKFGQIIGEMVEEAVAPILKKFAAEHGLYLDRKGHRPARRTKQVSWFDEYGNKHDLDFVLERGGAPDRVGDPVAFIESAWRRYTKHSRNKAQEIQGALLPLLAKHKLVAPFLGVIAAGVYTEAALSQLRSVGFRVLHFDYETVCQAFAAVKLGARFDEDTPDADCLKKTKAWERLSPRKRSTVAKALVKANKALMDEFLEALHRTVTRRIDTVRVTPLYGKSIDVGSVESAISIIKSCPTETARADLLRYEILIRYNNGDVIEAAFAGAESAIQFLEQYNTLRFSPDAR